MYTTNDSFVVLWCANRLLTCGLDSIWIMRTKANFMGIAAAFVLGGFLIYYGTMMGFACPDCKFSETWLSTFVPWLLGAALFGVAGWFYHRARPDRSLFVSVLNAIVIGVATLFGLFLVVAIVAGLLRKD